MAQIDDLTALATTLGADLSALSTEVTTALADLKAQQAAPAPDLGPVIAKFQTIDTGLKTLAATVQAADPGTPAAS